jgi:hypothetical protein
MRGVGIVGFGASAAASLAMKFDESARSINKFQYQAKDLGTTADYLYRMQKVAEMILRGIRNCLISSE